MDEHQIEREIKETAYQIAQPTVNEDLFDAQLSYWLSVQSLMKLGGYEAVRKRTSHVSERLASIIEKSSFTALRRLCLGEISTIRPSLPESTMTEILENSTKETILAKMTLQILAEQNKRQR